MHFITMLTLVQTPSVPWRAEWELWLSFITLAGPQPNARVSWSAWHCQANTLPRQLCLFLTYISFPVSPRHSEDCPPTAPIAAWNLGDHTAVNSYLFEWWFFNKPFWASFNKPWNITKWLICTRVLKVIWALVPQAGRDWQKGAHIALAFPIPVLGAVRRLEPLGQSVHYF